MKTAQRNGEASWNESRGLWLIKVQKDGVRKQFSSAVKGRKGKHIAENRADEWLASGQSDIPFAVAWAAFLDDERARTSAANVSKIECIGRLHIAPVIGVRKVSRITPIIWQSCINAAFEKGLSRRSLINIRATIAAFVKYAHRARLVVDRLEDGDIIIPNGATPEKEKKILQPDDIRILFTESTIRKSGRIVTAHYIYAWRFLVLTGLRRGELCGLRNEDVTDSTVTVRRSINSIGEETNGKNDNARRTFVLSEPAKKVLADQCAYLKSIGIISPWIFPDEWGERACPKSVADRWGFYCNQHGFRTTIHGLRHTFISIGKADLPLELMKAVVGHSTSMDTYKIYGHEVDGEAQRAAQIMGNVFDGILNPKVGE